MAKKMALPKIGVNMTEAVISKWLVKTGDKICDGDPIMEAETDKSTQEIYATESGTVAKLLASQGDTVQCGQDILVLAADGEAYTVETTESVPSAKKEPAGEKISPKEVVTQARAACPAERVRISPLAKKVAKEMGIDYRNVRPKMQGGRIVKNDVVAYAGNSCNHAVDVIENTGENMEIIPLTPTRKVIGARMSESNLTKPCAALTLTADAEALLALRKKYKEKGINVSVDAILAKIAGAALRRHRMMNAVLEGDSILIKQDINVGIAVDAPKGLAVAVVRHADLKPLVEIAEEVAAMSVAAKESQLGIADMMGGTFTITNLGMFGIEQFTPIINPPECCILSVGAIVQTFVPDENGQPALRSRFQMTLVFDHRIVDGAPAAKFLRDIKEWVETPALLL